MPFEHIKFYQTGTFTVGNRLLDVSNRAVQSDVRRSNTLNSGHRACQGCGEALGARYAVDAAVRAADGNLIAVNATGCLEVFSTPYPETSWQVAWMHSLFGNAAAVAAGVAAAMKAQGRNEVRVIAQGGDGGTADIGMGCLSGMFERNDDVLYICYDNEAYMNTGVQRSGTTPAAARTATTPSVGSKPGNVFGQGKSVPLIAMAHMIPYVATASVANLHDLEYKVEKAIAIHGARYIHVHVPCPLGWGSEPHDTIKVARLAVESGLFPLFEAEFGEVTERSIIRRKQPAEEYLKLQKRFAHLFRPKRDEERLAAIQAIADRNIQRFGLQNGASSCVSLSPSPWTSAPAWPITPVHGAPSGRSTWIAFHLVTTRARRAKTFKLGSITPSRATITPPGSRWWRIIRCPRSWAAPATIPANRSATARSSIMK